MNLRGIIPVLWFCCGLCCSAGEKYTPHRLPRPLIFSQAQLKYTLNPHKTGIQYFSHWIDWPLFIDSNLQEKGQSYRGVQYPDFKRIQKIMKGYGLDGVGFWQEHARYGWMSDILTFAARSQCPDFRLFFIVSDRTDVELDVGRFLQSPQAVRLDGKVLLISTSSNNPKLARFRDKIVARYGDKFKIIDTQHFYYGDMQNRFHLNGQKFTAADRQKVTGIIRKSLREFDGFGWWDTAIMMRVVRGRRLFDREFYQALMQLTAKIFKEPQYRDKIFMAEAMVGHENSSFVGYTMTSGGTQTLRDTLQIALANGVDIINIPEWDEQNENTSLRPTVYNGTSHLRILRHLTAQQRGKSSEPLPCDDIRIPNLIISMRKIVALGELLEFELLNIPDRTNRQPYQVELQLKNLQGQVVQKFPAGHFDGRTMQEHRVQIGSEKFARERVLIPKLIVTRGKKKQIYSSGLSVVQLQSTWNFDYKWVKQPLRDLLIAPQVQFKVTPDAEPGMFVAQADIKSPELLSFAEVLDNGDCIFSADTPASSWRETAEYLVFRVAIKSIMFQNVTGTIRLTGTTPQWRSKVPYLNYLGHQFNFYHRGDWVRMPRKDWQRACFEIDLPGFFTGKIPVRDILAQQSIVLGGPRGFNLALTRQLRQYFHPQNLNCRELKFQLKFYPDLINSVLQLQLIAPNGKIWRSRPVVITPPDHKNCDVVVYSEAQGAPVRVAVPQNYVPDLRYQWSNAKGLLVPVDFGRTLWGIRGGYVDLACMRNSGGDSSTDGVPCKWQLSQQFWKNSWNLIPQIVASEGGVPALQFKAHGEFVGLPKGSIPRRSGFTISFEIKPQEVQNKQYIMANSHQYPGAFRYLFIEGGILKGCFVNCNLIVFALDSQLPLRPDCWNKVKITYDLKQFIFEVNGKKSLPMRAIGPGVYDIPVMWGTWGQESFRGQLRKLHIRHTL